MSRAYVRKYIDGKDWRLYVAIALGITLAGTGAAFLLSNRSYPPPPPPAIPRKLFSMISIALNIFIQFAYLYIAREELRLDTYESMTDAIISVMTPEVIVNLS